MKNLLFQLLNSHTRFSSGAQAVKKHLLSKGSWFYFCIKHFLFSKTAPFGQFSMPADSITPQNGKFLKQGAALDPQQLLSGNSLVYYCVAE